MTVLDSMTDVSSVSMVVGSAFTSMMSTLGASSLGRLITGAESVGNNLINGVVQPANQRAIQSRGYKFRNNTRIGANPELTFQQLQVTKTSNDLRINKIQRDAVNLLSRACQTSEALTRVHPTFDDIGSVHLRLTLPVPTTSEISGFTDVKWDGRRARAPKPDSESDGAGSDEVSKDGASSCSSWGDEYETLSEISCKTQYFSGGPAGPPGLGGLFQRRPLERSDSSFEDGFLVDEPEPTRTPIPPGAYGNALVARETIDLLSGTKGCISTMVDCECPHLKWAVTGAKDGVMKVFHIANPSGARDLYVLDVTMPTEVFTCCMETADSLVGEDKPAKNLNLQKAQRKLRRVMSGKLDQSAYNYLETITNLVTMAILLDIGDSGKDHCHILEYSGVQSTFKDFFAGTTLEAAMEDVNDAKKEAGHPVENIVRAVPAPDIAGSLNETIVLYETAEFGEYDLKERVPVVGAVKMGVDLFGKPSPNDHTNPLNYIGAVYRHLGDSESVVAEGTPFEYVIHLDRSEKSKLTPELDRVWDDMIDDHLADFKRVLTSNEQRFDFDFLDDGKPGSYSTEKYEKWLEEQISDERFFTTDNVLLDLMRASKHSANFQQLKAKAQVKKGEDSSRARAVITPGIAGSEGLHQARISPLIKALEALHAILYNHTNLKGLTEETKRIRFAEFLKAVPKGAVVWGTDNSKNDSCFREAVWKKVVTYLAKMADLFEEHTSTRPYVYSPNEATADESFPTGTLDMKYWMMKLTPLLAILLSGVGPTSFANRLQSTAANGAAVLRVFGEDAYNLWRQCERNGAVSNHPAWGKHALPHVAEFVEWAPLKPVMVTDTSIKVEDLKTEQIKTYHMGVNEGDDQTHVMIPPKTAEWKDLSIKDTAMKYTAEISRATNFILEAALTEAEEDMKGRNSVFEMLSAYVGLPTGKTDEYEVAVIVPRPLKALRKLAHCTISSQHTKVTDDAGEIIDVVKDVNYWSLGLTKFYSLAIINRESLGVRGLFLAHGDHCYEQLETLLGRNAAYAASTIYGDRDPEKRQLEEVSSTTFNQCGAMRDKAHESIQDVKVDRVMRVCCSAWRSEIPNLSKATKEDVCAALRAFDVITLSTPVLEVHIQDPMTYWQELDIGCLLQPLVSYATANHQNVAGLFRSAKLLATPEETVKLAREYASTKPNHDTDKDGKSDNTGKGAHSKGGKGKGKSKGTGNTTTHSKGKGKGKGGGKSGQRDGKGSRRW